MTQRTKRDKIFDNKFDEIEYDSKPINFTVNSNFDTGQEIDDSIHDSMLFQKVDKIIKASRFADYANYENLSEDKLTKSTINEIYVFISQSVPEYTKVELFSVMSDYFDITPSKFYNSLSNKAKDELIMELDKKMNILQRRGIRKLF
jgi:hypothetical protein